MPPQIAEIIAQAEIYQNILQAQGYPKFYISFSVETLKPGVAGVALISPNSSSTGLRGVERVVKVSKEFLEEHHDEIITRTLGHEIAHHYVFLYYPKAKQGHGPEFRKIMNILQLNCETYHSMQLQNGPTKNTRTKTRYIYKTVTSGYEINLTHKQHLNNQNFSYKGEKLSYTGKIVTFK